MALTLTRLDLDDVVRNIGKATIWYMTPYWSSGDLSLTHLGDTDGPITITANAEYDHHTVPEVYGPAKVNSYIKGYDPTVSFRIWAGASTLLALASPNAVAGLGNSERQVVTSITLVVIPKQFFFKSSTGIYDATIAYATGGTWTKDGGALSTADAHLLAHSAWCWKGYFNKPDVVYSAENGDRAMFDVTFQCQAETSKPNNNRLITFGNPFTQTIEIDAA